MTTSDNPLERPTRVAFVTQWFPPEPATIPLGLARALRSQGLNVDVLTGVPNYPTGRVSQGYSAWRRSTETREGFRIRRTPLYPSHDHSTLRRTANYLSYAASSSLFGGAVLRAADVALVYSSPATAATAAMAARRRWGLPYVLMVMDLWPDSVFATGFLDRGPARRVAERGLHWFTDRTYRLAAHVTVTCPGMLEALVARGVPRQKVSVVYNWADEKLMQPTEPDPRLRAELGLTDGFVIMYGGNLGVAQRLDVAVRAMAELRDLPDVHLVLVGDGIERPVLRALVDELKLRTVHFVDRVAPERMAALAAAADLQLVSLADEPLFRITMPSKVQSIMACGQALLVCAPGDAARAVENAGAGFTAPPGDSVGLAGIIRHARRVPRRDLQAMGRNGRHHYLRVMSEEINSRHLADLLTSAARPGVRSGTGEGR
ncbi:glycosyltransferase family 4 protein [Micromonospora sp. NPDC007271]|uniref:glycosyltransferase family 4 protein n=1 Tax=Micromonospora sp. NPDC007271 TaxID=3154587 RepID=UPI0033ECEDAB